MDYSLSEHAQHQMRKRGLSVAEVESVLQNPQQIVDSDHGRKVYQSLIVKEGRLLILRVIVAVQATPPIVVSVYATTQGRYWQP